jgi:hypothetical protein
MIGDRQNSARQLYYLAAQRQLYATAKRVFGWQIFAGGPLAAFSTFVVIAEPSWKGIAASWGLLVTIADIVWLTPWQRRLKDTAARVQEAFDCDVLGLPWNEIKAGKLPDAELVKEQADKYARMAENMPPLKDWYAPVVDNLPLHIGRIACQRANCWWDSKQRRQYAVWIVVAVITTFIVVFSFSISTGSTLEDFVLKVIAPLAPTFLLGIRQYSEHTDTAARLDRLKEHADRLWNDALAGSSETELAYKSRSLQDEILENRRKSPLVLDYIFKRLRTGYEKQMNYGVEELVQQAKKIGL